MKRIYHHYAKLEEYQNGMWRNVSAQDRLHYSEASKILFQNQELFRKATLKLIDKWVYSCEHNLTNTSQNRIAWVGQAACCLEFGSPEDATRLAWWMLTEQERHKANIIASEAINGWEIKQCQKDQLELTF